MDMVGVMRIPRAEKARTTEAPLAVDRGSLADESRTRCKRVPSEPEAVSR
jgi:hypothetical protein